MSRRAQRAAQRPERDFAEHRLRWRSLADAAQDLALSMDWLDDHRFGALAAEASIARRAWTWAADRPAGGVCEVLAVLVHRWARMRTPFQRAALAPAVVIVTREVLGLLERVEAGGADEAHSTASRSPSPMGRGSEGRGSDEPGSSACAKASADRPGESQAEPPTLPYRADIDG